MEKGQLTENGQAISSLRPWLFVGSLLVSQVPCAAEDTGSVRLHVAIEHSLLVRDSSQKTSDRSYVPCQNAFLFVSPIKRIRKRHELVAWIRRNAVPAAPRHHRFQLVDGRVVPSAKLATVGDTVSRSTSDQQEVVLELFSGSPVGPSVQAIPKVRLSQPEYVPIQVSVPPSSESAAYMLISDHTLARLTDKHGNAEFKPLPEGMEIPLRISYPQSRAKVRFDSETLDIDAKGAFLIQAGGRSIEHTIRISAVDTR